MHTSAIHESASIFSKFTSRGSSRSLVALFCLLMSSGVYAADLPVPSKQAVSAEYLTGTSDMHGIRLAYRPAYSKDFELPLVGEVRLSWEAGLNFFDLHGSAKTETTYGASVSPILTKAIESWSPEYPLSIELGIGLAYVHDQKFGGVNIGSNYQFEDRIGVLMGLDAERNSQIAIRYIHYSNGGLNTKNPGLDYLSLVYMTRF